jgi:hypothetical protein
MNLATVRPASAGARAERNANSEGRSLERSGFEEIIHHDRGSDGVGVPPQAQKGCDDRQSSGYNYNTFSNH